MKHTSSFRDGNQSVLYTRHLNFTVYTVNGKGHIRIPTVQRMGRFGPPLHEY